MPLQLKPIEEEKKRNATSRKRISGLRKKLFQLTTLCDTQGFLICYDSAENLHTWPENSQQIQQIIDRYNGLDMEKRDRNKLDLSGLLARQIKKMQSDLDRKVRGAHPRIDEVEFELRMARERLHKLEIDREEEKCVAALDIISNADDGMTVETLSWPDTIWWDNKMIGNGGKQSFTDLPWYDDPWLAGSGFPSSSKECFDTIDVGDYDIVW